MPLQYYHFSVDDVLDCLLDVSPNPTQCWDHPFFAFLKSLWDTFRAHTDLYLFEQQNPEPTALGLRDVATQLRSTLSASPWLRFGPHARDPQSHPYQQSPDATAQFCLSIYKQLERFAGQSAFSRWLRFHFFSECYEQAELLAQYDVTTLLTTDKAAGCYRLPEACKLELLECGITKFEQLDFVRSHIRIENLLGFGQSNLDQALDELVGHAECAVVFTHENELARPEVRAMTVRVFEWIARRRLKPRFPIGLA